MEKAQRSEELRDQYRHLGFYPCRSVEVAGWDEGARIIRLTRRSKKRFVVGAGRRIVAGMIEDVEECEILGAAMRGYFLSLKCGE